MGEPGGWHQGKASSLRGRLAHLATPVLRLVLQVAAAFPDSEVVHQQVAGFVEAHPHMALRMLRDAAAAGALATHPSLRSLGAHMESFLFLPYQCIRRMPL